MRRFAPSLLFVALGAAIVAVAGWAYVQTRNPSTLMLGALAALVPFALAAFARPRSDPPPAPVPVDDPPWWNPFRWQVPPETVEVVKVRCASCRALGGEQARFCDQCGKPL